MDIPGFIRDTNELKSYDGSKMYNTNAGSIYTFFNKDKPEDASINPNFFDVFLSNINNPIQLEEAKNLIKKHTKLLLEKAGFTEIEFITDIRKSNMSKYFVSTIAPDTGANGIGFVTAKKP